MEGEGHEPAAGGLGTGAGRRYPQLLHHRLRRGPAAPGLQPARPDPYGRQEQWEDSPEGWPQDPPMSCFARTTSTDRKGIR